MNVKFDPKTTALLVIDVQRELFNRSTPIYKANELLDTLAGLIAAAHAAGAAVVYVQHNNKSILARGTPGWELHERLSPRAEELVIQKEHGNAFEATPLKAELEKVGVKTVLVSGLVTHGCVKASSMGALAEGYRVVVVQGAHSNYHKKAGQVIAETEAELAAAGVELIAAGEVRFLQETAHAPIH